MVPKRFTGSRIAAIAIVIVVALALWFMLRTPATSAEFVAVTRGDMTVTIDDLGETRVTDLFTVSAPVTGELLRVPLKAGAVVEKGRTLLAEIAPIRPNPLDTRSHAQASAQVSALEAQVAAASARVQEARAVEQLAAAEYARVAQLVDRGFVSRARYDQANAEMVRSRAASREAGHAVDAARHSLQAARATLAQGGVRGAPVRVAAPVSGTVLRVIQESDRTVVSGTPILEIGDPARLEIVADLLSADAVRVRPGAAVLIDAWGGERPLMGRVRLVEPYGFTKISALGVEEQRVNVVIDFAEPRLAWQRLGHGYRVTVRVVLWEGRGVLRVPVGALFRDGGEWAVFAVGADNRAARRRVGIGHMNDTFAQVLSGLGNGDRVIVHPGEKVDEGRRVKAQ